MAKKEKPKRELYKIKKVGGDKNAGERKVLIKKPVSFWKFSGLFLWIMGFFQKPLLGSERIRTRPKCRKAHFSKHKRSLRKTLTPGTVVIILAGRHKGKVRVFKFVLDLFADLWFF